MIIIVIITIIIMEDMINNLSREERYISSISHR